jgi:hypothetical protein
VENGADLTAVDQNGHCCLFYAASSGDLLIVKTLVEEFNVDISRTNAKGKTPAEMAVGKCASYLHHCLKNPPKKNRDFVPERYLKKDPVAKRLKEPRSIGTYLMKKSPSLLKGWQKRYFVMKEGYLRYYGTVSTMCIFVYVYFSLSTYVLYLLIIESGIWWRIGGKGVDKPSAVASRWPGEVCDHSRSSDERNPFVEQARGV